MADLNQTSFPLLELKNRYGKLFRLHLKDTKAAKDLIFIFRPLTVSEYKFYRNLQLTRPGMWYLAEKEIYEKCILKASIPSASSYSEDFIRATIADLPSLEHYDDADFLPAGIIPSVVNCIIYYSYPKSVNDWTLALERERDKQGYDLEYKLRGLICTIFNYKPEETADMTIHSILERVVMAENTVTNRMELPIKVVTKEEADALRSAQESNRTKSPRELSREIEDDARSFARAGIGHDDADKAIRRQREIGKDPKAVYEEQVRQATLKRAGK